MPNENIEIDQDAVDQQDWHWRLTSVKFTPAESAASDVLRDMVGHIGDTVIAYMPRSRERSLALTHLEEALMWINKGIARGL